jgi:hypothetical protein
MLIDAHTHLGLSGAKAEELVASMNTAGIDKALVLSGEINHYSVEQLLADTAPYRGTLYPVGSISPLSPQTPSVEAVERWLSSKQIFGLKFYPGYEHFYPADETLRPYLELLATYRRPAIFHSGDTWNGIRGAKLKYAQAIHIDDLAVEMPDLNIIIAHLGYPWETDAAEVCYKNSNVYADCSGFVYDAFTAEQVEHFRQVAQTFLRISNARDRILFGTDWPIGNQASYVRTAQVVFGEDFPSFYSQNAIKLFGLE